MFGFSNKIKSCKKNAQMKKNFKHFISGRKRGPEWKLRFYVKKSIKIKEAILRRHEVFKEQIGNQKISIQMTIPQHRFLRRQQLAVLCSQRLYFIHTCTSL